MIVVVIGVYMYMFKKMINLDIVKDTYVFFPFFSKLILFPSSFAMYFSVMK